MLTVSLHGIHITAPIGLYTQEQVLSNKFEVDVDVSAAIEVNEEWPLMDYTYINALVQEAFSKEEQLLETIVKNIYHTIKRALPKAEKVRVAVRKLHPPMKGHIAYAQVCYEG